MDLNKARGAVYGMAVGDALGATLEFSEPQDCPAWPTLMSGPQIDILGGGPFKVKRGQVTDDTQMAICIAKAITEHKGFFSVDIIAKHYMEWYDDLFDGGRTTLASIENLKNGSTPEFSGEKTWLLTGKKASGNGSLMRTSVIGAYFSIQGVEKNVLTWMTLMDGRITHFDFRCQFACVVHNNLIDDFIHNRIEKKTDILPRGINYLHETEKILRLHYPEHVDRIQQNRKEIQHDLVVGTLYDSPGLYEEKGLHIIDTQGFVRVAFRLAIWELVHTNDYKTALIDVINRGGDSDTNGAIVGGLLGAYYGETGIPQEWRDTVENCFADDPTSIWGDKYHPRHLFNLIK